MSKISILHPSYKRPKLGVSTMFNWLSRADNPQDIEYILCLHEKDHTVTEYASEMLKHDNLQNVKVIYSQEANMVKQVNLAAKESTGNLLINVSDDFDCPQSWDSLLLKELEGKEDYVVKTQDGIQKEIITLPILDRRYYERFNFIYAPEFSHFYGDQELREVGDILGKTIVLDLMFEHIHYIAGKAPKDEVNDKNNAHFEEDKKTYFKRKARKFDL